MQIAKQRLYLNADKTALVEVGHAKAATLYCTPGDAIPDSAVERFGLVDGKLKKAKSGSDQKENKPSPNKEKKGGSDKEQKPGGGKGGPSKPPELTDIGGIGAATAKKLADQGVGTVEAFASLTDELAAKLTGMPPAFDFAAAIAAAKALLPPAAPTDAQ
tara:strand:+ start:515 stop:994 length:480 start_codon:yes stop_codon:yes gene_type:complete